MYRARVSVRLDQGVVLIDYVAVNHSHTSELDNAVISGEPRCLHIHHCQPRCRSAAAVSYTHSLLQPRVGSWLPDSITQGVCRLGEWTQEFGSCWSAFGCPFWVSYARNRGEETAGATQVGRLRIQSLGVYGCLGMRERRTIDDVLSGRAAVARRWFEVPVLGAALLVIPVVFIEEYSSYRMASHRGRDC